MTSLHRLGASEHYHLPSSQMGRPTAARTIANGAKKALRGVEFDSIVGTGVSGAIALPVLADRLGVTWAYVRKEGDTCHSNAKIEGIIGDRWLFIDDFRGFNTRLRVIRSVCLEAMREGFETTYIGAYYYHQERGRHYVSPNRDDELTIERAKEQA